jgi:serine/threonine protein kinase
MVMELLKGETLQELIQGGGVTPQEAIPIFAEICGALSEAHQKGIIHRDIKPHNIMLQDVSGSRFAKVFDFGLARHTNSMDARLSTSGVVMGTFRYMSPEQALGEDVDQRTDIFSLGVVLYEVLSGRHPFPGKNLFELFTLHQNGPPPLPEVSPDLADLVMRSLAYEKDSRFSSCDEFRTSLQFWLGESLSGRGYISPMYNNESGGVMTRPPLVDQQQASNSSKAYSPISAPGARQLKGAPAAGLDSGSQHTPSSNAGIIGAILALFVAVGGVGGYLIFSGDNGTTKNRTEPRQRVLTNRGSIPSVPRRHAQPRPQTPARRLTQPRVPVRQHKQTPPPFRMRRSRPPRRRYRRRVYRNRRRTYPRRRRVEPRLPRVRPIARPIIERRPPPVVVRPRPIVRPRVIVRPPPRPVVRKRLPPPCPTRGSLLTYRQLDRALGRQLNTRTSRIINRAVGSTVYDAGLQLSQSWKSAPITCKKSYLCGKIQRLLNGICRAYRPMSHCSGYRPSRVTSGGRTRYTCIK